jgi:hypothetical protein
VVLAIDLTAAAKLNTEVFNGDIQIQEASKHQMEALQFIYHFLISTADAALVLPNSFS